MIGSICLIVLMTIATITDLRQQKIYNWTTYTGIVLALVLGCLVTAFNRTEFLDIGIGDCLIGFLSCGAIMLVCFVLFQIGGGDVKLLAMAGAFLGLQLGIETLLWTFVLGGAMAVIILIWKIGFVRLVKRVIQQLMLKLSFKIWDPLTEEEESQLKLPLYLAPSALLATLIVKFSLVNRLAEWVG